MPYYNNPDAQEMTVSEFAEVLSTLDPDSRLVFYNPFTEDYLIIVAFGDHGVNEYTANSQEHLDLTESDSVVTIV